MNNQEILEKAIAKAIEGGWNGGGTETEITFDYDQYDGYRVHIMAYQGKSLQSFIYSADEEIIFNHDFAKALWPNPPGFRKYNMQFIAENGVMNGMITQLDCWQHHLVQLTLAPNPIEYLGDNI